MHFIHITALLNDKSLLMKVVMASFYLDDLVLENRKLRVVPRHKVVFRFGKHFWLASAVSVVTSETSTELLTHIKNKYVRDNRSIKHMNI